MTNKTEMIEGLEEVIKNNLIIMTGKNTVINGGDVAKAALTYIEQYYIHKDEVQPLVGLLWYAWQEMNAIRARDGAPDGVCPDYWDKLVTLMAKTLGDDCTPWPSDAARSLQDALEKARDDDK